MPVSRPPYILPSPSPGNLVDLLVALAKAVARWVFGIGSYDAISDAADDVRHWFEYQLDYITFKVNWAWWNLHDTLALIINEIRNDLTDVAGTARDAWLWVKGFGKKLYDSYWDIRGKLKYFADNIYSWLLRFWQAPARTVKEWLGAAWSWLYWFYNNKYAAIAGILGAPWAWVDSFWRDKYNTVADILGKVWTWVREFYYARRATITSILGSVWTYLESFANYPVDVLNKALGGAVLWLLDLFGVARKQLTAFCGDPITFWLHVYSLWRNVLVSFLGNPSAFILACIRATFIDWLEQLIVDHW